jgi:hypothetical protein
MFSKYDHLHELIYDSNKDKFKLGEGMRLIRQDMLVIPADPAHIILGIITKGLMNTSLNLFLQRLNII